MKRLMLLPLFLILGCLVAGLYGSLHNQISYSISSDYFHQFKFIQFHIPLTLQNRLGASIVGWHASWWMGIVIGFVILPISLTVPGLANYCKAVLRTFVVVAVTALVFGLCALLYACFSIDESNVARIVLYGNEINNPVAFMRAGTMHNFSYLGGLIGIVTGMIWLFVERSKANKRLKLDGRP
jgi:hypothetical protein